MHAKSKAPKNKGAGALDLLGDIMAGIEIPVQEEAETAPEPEPEAHVQKARAVPKKNRKDQVAMMRALKQSQNASAWPFSGM